MSEFNFKSAVCTNRQQSERLLSLGLKKETADMCLEYNAGNYTPKTHRIYGSLLNIPAWSLHRLMILAATPLELDEMLGYNVYDYYDNAIDHIESLIKEGYFNKEYLCEK